MVYFCSAPVVWFYSALDSSLVRNPQKLPKMGLFELSMDHRSDKKAGAAVRVHWL